MDNNEMDIGNFFPTFLGALLVAASLLAGCGADGSAASAPPDEPKAETVREQGKRVFARPTWTTSSVGDQTTPTPSTPFGTDPAGVSDADEKTAKPTGDLPPRETWAILLGVATGPGADRQAATLAALASKEAGLKDVMVERRGDGFAALAGAYDDPGSAEAKRDLAVARAFSYQGGKPFEAAIMAAPAKRGVAGSNPEHDLRNVRQFTGQRRLNTTLQVGIYGRLDRVRPSDEDLADIRKAAEEAVRVLRAEGVKAYYYHGPERSTVCIGAFESSADPEFRVLQKRYPRNLVNGQLVEPAKARAMGIDAAQPSFPVTIPKE
jgi:hypothetical protein